MAGLPNNFLTQNPAIETYDWIDYNSGFGYRTLYAACAEHTGPTLVYFLTQRAIDSDYNYKSTSIVNTNTELNFDLEFKNPAIIGGEAFINWSTSSNGAADVYAIFTIYHVSLASAETSLGTKTSSTISTGAGNTYWRRLTKVTLTNKSFAIGEKIRLEVKFYSTGAVTSSAFYHDPGSRFTMTESGVGATMGSDLAIDLPFKIDL